MIKRNQIITFLACISPTVCGSGFSDLLIDREIAHTGKKPKLLHERDARADHEIAHIRKKPKLFHESREAPRTVFKGKPILLRSSTASDNKGQCPVKLIESDEKIIELMNIGPLASDQILVDEQGIARQDENPDLTESGWERIINSRSGPKFHTFSFAGIKLKPGVFWCCEFWKDLASRIGSIFVLSDNEFQVVFCPEMNIYGKDGYQNFLYYTSQHANVEFQVRCAVYYLDTGAEYKDSLTDRKVALLTENSEKFHIERSRLKNYIQSLTPDKMATFRLTAIACSA